MKKDYDRIKDLYGEKMAKFCRSNFPTIMAEGKMFDILYSTFAPTKVLYLDLESDISFAKDFQQLIFLEFEKQNLDKKIELSMNIFSTVYCLTE